MDAITEAVQSAMAEIPEQVESENVEGQSAEESGDNIEGQSATESENVEGQSAEGDKPTEEKPLTHEELQAKYTTLESDNKILQDEFGKRNEAQKASDARFDAYGGPDNLLKVSELLANSPKIRELLEEERAKLFTGGQDADNIDPEEKEVWDKIGSVVDQKVKQEVDSIRKKEIEPIRRKHLEERNDMLFKQMDSGPYGEFWNDYNDTMRDIVSTLPREAIENMDLKGLETVFLVAVNQRGDMGKIQAAAYKKTLDQAKSKTMNKPTNNAPTNVKKTFSTVEESAAFALQQNPGVFQ